MAQTALCSVLVRRDDQLATLEDALLEARRGRGRLVVLAGEAELSLPYLPFVEAIGNYLAQEDASELAARLGPTSRELSQLFPQFGDGQGTVTQDPGQAKLR